jgi:hypothetical protein
MTVRKRVTGRRLRMRPSTGVLLTMESPRSPRKKLSRKTPN